MFTFKIPQKKQFQETFLKPLSRYSESIRLKISDSSIESISVDVSTGSVMYASYDTSSNKGLDLDTEIICLRNINKLSFFLDNITEESPSFTISDSTLTYTEKRTKFKLHLLDNSVIALPPLTVDAIKSLSFDHTFSIDSVNMSRLNSLKSMCAEVKKVYFSCTNGIVMASVTDRSQDLTDEASIEIGECSTDFDEFGIVFAELSKKIDFGKKAVDFSYRQEDGIVKIEMGSELSKLVYIVSTTTN